MLFWENIIILFISPLKKESAVAENMVWHNKDFSWCIIPGLSLKRLALGQSTFELKEWWDYNVQHNGSWDLGWRFGYMLIMHLWLSKNNNIILIPNVDANNVDHPADHIYWTLIHDGCACLIYYKHCWERTAHKCMHICVKLIKVIFKRNRRGTPNHNGWKALSSSTIDEDHCCSNNPSI